jgi:hypothetical protein
MVAQTGIAQDQALAKVAAADRLCRMALFDVLAPAELLDFASENNGVIGVRPRTI